MAHDPFTGAKMLSGCQPMGFDYFEGLGEEESKDKLEELMNAAYGPIEVGELNEDLETVRPPRRAHGRGGRARACPA